MTDLSSEDGIADGDPTAIARSNCLSQLTRGPRTRAQLATTLSKRLVPPAVAEEVLDRLTEVGLIDDAAFARAWVESRRTSRGLSARALARELHERGVAEDLVKSATADLGPEDEESTARQLAERGLRKYPPGVPIEVRLRRTVALLGRKGYPPGLAYRVVRAAAAEQAQ
jgi:regulatory protein